MSENVSATSDAGFEEEVVKSNTPVLVDFWAAWCGPCKMLAPILKEVAESHKDKLRVATLDIDANPDTPAQFGIRSIPTLMLFKDGQAIATKSGALSKAQLTAFIDSNL